MKCLMRMFAAQDKGVVFYETVLTLKQQKHTFVECVPLPWEQFEEIPGYFRVSGRPLFSFLLRRTSRASPSCPLWVRPIITSLRSLTRDSAFSLLSSRIAIF
jgi:hypothetical protein